MIIRKGFKFRLLESAAQAALFRKSAGSCRFVFNRGLSRRKEAWEKDKTAIALYQQNKELTLLKQQEETTWLKDVHSQILQQSLRDLDLAFQHFFERVRKKEENPGYPKFKCKWDHDSFRYPQGVKVEDDRVWLPKIGWVRFKKTREILGAIHQTTVIREGNHWYVCFSCEWEEEVFKEKVQNAIAIDLGLDNFVAAKSHVEEWMVKNPRFLRKGLSHLRYLSRQLSHKIKKSKNFYKAKAKLASFHRRIKNQRMDFLHKLSTELVKNHDAVIVENLNVKSMLEDDSRAIARSIGSAGWRSFLQMIKYKCEYLGKYFIELDRYFPSTKQCHNCNQINDMPLEKRLYECSCGIRVHRDTNATRTQLAAGMAVLKACGAVGVTRSCEAGILRL